MDRHMRMKYVLLSSVVLLLSALGAAGYIFWRHPIDTLAWMHRRDLKNAGIQERMIATSFGQQAVWIGGNGPTVVLLHGAGDQAGAWNHLAPTLLPHYRVIALDLAGHGDSEPKKGPLPLGTIYGGLESVLNATNDGKPVTIVGNSLGGWMAMLYAYRNPSKVQRVIAVDGGPLKGERPDLVELPRTRAEAARLFDNILDPGTPRPPGFVLDDVVRESNTGPIGRMASLGAAAMGPYLLEGRLQEMKVPVDIVWGDADRLIPMSYAKRMEAQLPAARLTVLPRCGHAPQQECPITLTRTIVQLLNEPAPEPTEKKEESR